MSDEPKKETPVSTGARAAESNAAPQPDRRRFIAWLLGLPSAIVAILLCIPLVRESLYPVYAKGAGGVTWSDLGSLDQFQSLTAPSRQVIKIKTVDGWRQTISEKVVYVSKNAAGQVEVLTAVCPHLGCEVAWIANQDHFHCPCHGGTFAPDGRYISGPPPRGMDTLPTTVQNGHLMVRYEYFQNLVPGKQVIG